MLSYHDNKKKQIQDILSVVKLGSVLFSGLIVLKSFRDIYDVFDAESYFNFMLVIIVTLSVSIIYYFWAFVWIKKTNASMTRIIEIIESVFFMLSFMYIVVITGLYESDYKVIFLLIIITATIQSGLKLGISIATVASAFLLVIDLILPSRVMVNQYFENDLIVSAIFYFTAWALGYYVKIEDEHVKTLEELANVDGLTGLFNHRFFYEKLTNKINFCKENKIPLALILMDIDHFKQYNDYFGHQTGDDVLRQVGNILKEFTNEDVVISRYGGDEFAAILTNMNEEEVFDFGEKIRNIVATTHFSGEEKLKSKKLTMSVGVAVCTEETKNDEELIKCADDALYRAKFYNRNRVELYTSVLEILKEDIQKEQKELISSMKTLISIINTKDRYTYGHIERVVAYSKLMADELNLSVQDKKNLILGAYIHDIGKINISEQVLNKQMPLTEEEWEILKRHPVDGELIIKPVSSLKDVAPIIIHHHERYDGTGYPGKLRGEEIPYLARIITVIDSFDAMTSDRPYGRRLTTQEALDELERCSGTQFDPEIVDAFIEVVQKHVIAQGKDFSKDNAGNLEESEILCV